MQWITCDSYPCGWNPRMDQLTQSASCTGFSEQHSPVSCSHCPPAHICGVSELCYVAQAAKGQCNQNESLCTGEVWHSEIISPVQSKNWSAHVDPGTEGGHLGLKKSLQAVHVQRQCHATSRPRRAHTVCWVYTYILSLFTFWKAAPGMSAIWHVAYYSCIADRTLQPANPSPFLHKGSSL